MCLVFCALALLCQKTVYRLDCLFTQSQAHLVLAPLLQCSPGWHSIRSAVHLYPLGWPAQCATEQNGTTKGKTGSL